MEPTLKSGAILMKFTQDVGMDEKISWTKNFENRTEGRGTPHRPIFFTKWCDLDEIQTGCGYGRESILDKKDVFF